MNTDKITILKNLIIDYLLPDLDEVNLAEVYTYGLKLRNGTPTYDIRDINPNTLINNFINECQLNSAPSTIYIYTKLLQDLLHYVRGVLTCDVLTAYLHSKVWGGATKRRNYGLLKRFLFYLFTQKYIEIDISSMIKVPPKIKSSSFCPMSTQVKQFIDSIKFVFLEEDEIKKYETLFKLYVKTGSRRNELLNLNVEDIDFNTGRVIIRKTKNKDVKVINMDDNLRQLLITYLNHFKYKSGPLFRGSQGNRLCKQTLMNVFHKIKARAGLQKDFKIHSLRRFFINELRKNHVDLATIQKLAGHRDIRTTEIYCNISDEEKVKALESIKV
ncbi:MAG: site-specific integrase [Actinobacteria bacterium]|nr:site-specific integrase [Actinomycetota bacterium]